MPNRQRHRGKHSSDKRLFGKSQLPALRLAVSELSWLLGRGYAERSSLKLVGDRHRLNARQRMAVLRSTCSESALLRRKQAQVLPAAVMGQPLFIDGFNILISVECMLSGAYLFSGMDGCVRDIAGVHGSYHRISETADAMRLIAETLHHLQITQVTWALDAPVSNSGRLRQLLLDTASENGWQWEVELHNNPDKKLAGTTATVATTDGWILDRVGSWLNLNREIIQQAQPGICLVCLA